MGSVGPCAYHLLLCFSRQGMQSMMTWSLLLCTCSWLREHQHLRYMWIPYTDTVVVVQSNPEKSKLVSSPSLVHMHVCIHLHALTHKHTCTRKYTHFLL